MNQHQRKFLLDEIEKQYRKEKDELNERRPKAPSLNNFLLAAILDGTAKMKPVEEVGRQIRDRVRDMGKSQALVSERESIWGRGRRDDDDEKECINVPALTLFDEPPAYAELREKYEADLAKWKAEVAALEAGIAAMRIKVQVGSDRALLSIVDQADQICSMSLTASSRLIAPSSEPKRLSEGEK